MPKEKEKGGKVPVRKGKGEMVSWHPSDIFKEMDRVFDDFRVGFESLFLPERRWTWPIRMPRITLPEVRAPFCDLVDTGKEYTLCAEMPGIPKEKIDINIDKDSVEISAEAKIETEAEKKGYVSRERSYSRFYRSMSFPEEVLPDKAEAKYENGLLNLKVPKKTPTEIKKHKVKIE
ncbi:Hsp20/alpha crystallin family protein [[Eubacterium] cellulosolvens]